MRPPPPVGGIQRFFAWLEPERIELGYVEGMLVLLGLRPWFSF